MIFAASLTSICLKSQFGETEQSNIHIIVNREVIFDYLELSVEPSTVFEQSCEYDREMCGRTDEQKQVIKNLYKYGRKIVHSESHIKILSKSLEQNLIPKSFKISKEIPGNKVLIKNKQN